MTFDARSASSAMPAVRNLRRGLMWSLALLAALPALAAIDPATVPEPKRSKPALYLEAKEVPGFIAARGGATQVLFLDIRTRAEVMFLGIAQDVDASVPFTEMQEIITDWDTSRAAFKLEPVQNFVPEVTRRLADKGLGKNDVVVLICRSGDRSARAATRLADDGYTQVYSVVDGFEGDMSKDGRRSVNGWKNAGLPWTYKLDRAKMYLPR